MVRCISTLRCISTVRCIFFTVRHQRMWRFSGTWLCTFEAIVATLGARLRCYTCYTCYCIACLIASWQHAANSCSNRTRVDWMKNIPSTTPSGRCCRLFFYPMHPRHHANRHTNCIAIGLIYRLAYPHLYIIAIHLLIHGWSSLDVAITAFTHTQVEGFSYGS